MGSNNDENDQPLTDNNIESVPVVPAVDSDAVEKNEDEEIPIDDGKSSDANQPLIVEDGDNSEGGDLPLLEASAMESIQIASGSRSTISSGHSKFGYVCVGILGAIQH